MRRRAGGASTRGARSERGRGTARRGQGEVGAREGKSLAQGPAQGFPTGAEEVTAEGHRDDHDGEGDLVPEDAGS